MQWDKAPSVTGAVPGTRTGNEEWAGAAVGGRILRGTPGEGVSCRAGRSAFWINWQGGMTPCGMMTQPLVSVPELGFARAWEETKAATARIRLPGVCAGCRLKKCVSCVRRDVRDGDRAL